jgi:hypothetical protein
MKYLEIFWHMRDGSTVLNVADEFSFKLIHDHIRSHRDEFIVVPKAEGGDFYVRWDAIAAVDVRDA